MAGTFHWIRVRVFCYATEDTEKIRTVVRTVSGKDDLETEMSDGHHGNDMMIISAGLKGAAECKAMFARLGNDLIKELLDGVDDRMDDDCVFHFRIDKQAAVSGTYVTARHGDVVSITCKVASHPAKKDVASENMRKFLENLF